MIGHHLNATALVYRPTFTPDGRGGRVESFDLVGPIRVKVNQPSGDERVRAAREGFTLTYGVHMAASSDVRRDDDLEVNGLRFRVLGVVTDSRGTYLRADCEVVQVGP